MKFIIFSVGSNVAYCGNISGVNNPASPSCLNAQTGIICEISLVSITKYLIDFIIKTKVLLTQT